MTYVYPLLPGYDNARYILNHLMKKYRSTIEVIFLPLHKQRKNRREVCPVFCCAPPAPCPCLPPPPVNAPLLPSIRIGPNVLPLSLLILNTDGSTV
jgi:hypothetical protein